jgi:hypothetical protein
MVWSRLLTFDIHCMDAKSLAFAGYGRSALADAALGSGALTKEDVNAFLHRPLDELESGVLHEDVVAQMFEGEAEDVQTVDVVLRPQVLILKLAHGQARRNAKPAFVAPLLSTALLSRSGRFYPTGHTVVPRDLLEPLERPALAIGTVDTQDTFLTTHSAPRMEPADPAATDGDLDEQWRAYRTYCASLFAAVAEGWQSRDDGYIEAEYWCVAKTAAVKGAALHILALYDHLAENRPHAPLFDRYACDTPAARLACLPPHARFAARLGHASDTYPLADAQRDSLSHLLAGYAGDITCVNGPPGTGKTTLLLSVVATLWAQAALEGGEAPVIVAASTNNQAVTNVIDAFGRDFAAGTGPLAGRWLPDVRSFGAYFPAQRKEAEAAARYQTRAFFETVENAAFVAKAEAHYLERAGEAFPDLQARTVDAVLERLQDAVRAAAGKLARLEDLWSTRSRACAALHDSFGATPHDALRTLHEECAAREADLQAARSMLDQWESYLASESIWLTLFGWLPPVARKRSRLAKQFWKAIGADTASWEHPEQAEASVEQRVVDHAARIAVLKQEIARGEALMSAMRRATDEWATAARPYADNAALSDLAAVDCALDTQLRFDVFRLATHYWEGRWLLDMKAILPDLDKQKRKNGRVAVEARWRRRMKLTPCAVSTFFMLPSLFKVQQFEGGEFLADYLYDAIDLLIVDEAGQVLPEVAGAAFALAKRALVIGDTMQIPPIWSVPRHVDGGNLIEHDLLEAGGGDASFQRIATSGRTASSGSVMRIAQHASHYQYAPDLSPGLYLYEHRRCYDEIIAYCNALCYKGKLLPRRGPRPADADGLPALGYLHVDGICQRSRGGSAYNLLEAQTIAAWLKAHRTALEARYGKPLAQIVGVVTPFSAQVDAIETACGEVGLLQPGAITIGTVHALQGAERPVVIFSSCYSKHLDGGFIDRDPSMLNVAVSRAKDSFLVFGDMDVLETAGPASPRGMLAGFLFGDDANALRFDMGPRADLTVRSTGVTHLRDAHEHDAFLLEVLASAQREVRIMTPWIRPDRIRAPTVWNALQEAIARGVAVHVYTDEEFNVAAPSRDEVARNREALHGLLDALGRDGVHAATVRKVHSKIVTADRSVCCVGSFNWFSASRDDTYARHETSMVYRGTALKSEIDAIRDSLERRVKRRYPAAVPA